VSIRARPGDVGEIVVRGPVVTQRYRNRERETARAKIADARDGGAWHRMGDVGHVDERGRLWFCGRASQRIARPAASTLFTVPVQAVFDEHPRVRRTALVGCRLHGELVPVLCVELEPGPPGADRATLVRELVALGAAHEHTRAVTTFLVHPGVPVDRRHNAKIEHEALRRWAEHELRHAPRGTPPTLDALR
jgi:acyl-CoA synthetase (AMP-forming)/AMP-acid ligase II